MDFLDVVYMAAVLILAVLWWLHCFSSSDTSKANLPPAHAAGPSSATSSRSSFSAARSCISSATSAASTAPSSSSAWGSAPSSSSSSDLIHEALVRRGPLFASRPPDSPTRIIFSSGKRTINSAPYGPLWRSLRRNLVSQLVSPSRLPSFSWIRHWAVSLLLSRLREASGGGAAAVEIMPHLRLTICSILACICFGVKVAEEKIKEIEEVLKEIMLMTTPKLADFLPALTPLFRSQLRAARKLRQRQLDCLLPLVRARRAFVERGVQDSDWEMLVPAGEAYVDSLLTLDAAGPLGDEELVTLCSEVMSAGTDTSATSLEWAMLHIVLDQPAQERLHREVAAAAAAAAASGERIADEEDVEKMPYLTAVVKETLRRHPPSHFLLSHAATREAELGGYRIPAEASVEFYTAWVTEDPAIWERPKEWLPERFMEGGDGSDTDVTGTKSVRMTPFGAGRRICPAATLGMLHVHLLLANIVREFWLVAPPGNPPDPTEAFAFTVVMKHPLRAVLHQRNYQRRVKEMGLHTYGSRMLQAV
ncbi:hypothetical protein HPP92_015645 [Vanilla planifolia]|uniref:Cytochrome P450 n=1 Tax=Vanilla planifolia TaxID=51239 RepID=A0A835UPR1_VANPL|nr:hypothetical protein HPP92_015645 [Vanilla planifolia]